jgi:hypothetical protein
MNESLVEPPAEPPIIWSDDEKDHPDEGEQVNLVTEPEPEPRTSTHAMQGPQSNYWREATSLKYNTLVENRTREIVDFSHSEKVIGSGWVVQVKHNVDGSIELHSSNHHKGLFSTSWP